MLRRIVYREPVRAFVDRIGFPELMRRALDSARQGGLRRVELSVHADNARAIALYEKIGFVHEGRARDAVLIDGRYIDSLNMAIILGN